MNINNIYRRILNKINKRINKNDIWVFGEWFGERCCDNCLYLANYVVNNTNKVVYWISNENTDLSMLDDKIHRLIRDSKESKEIIDKSEVVVVNQSIYDVISDGYYVPKRSLVVNLWHGVPWKKILYDNVKNTSIIDKFIIKFNRYFFAYDMFLVPSVSFEKIMLNQVNKNVSLIKAGYPRNSIFYDKNVLQIIRRKVDNLFNSCKGKKIILYMPTFRDDSDAFFDFQHMNDNRDFIQLMRKNNAILIQKKHFIKSKVKYDDIKTEYVINVDNEISSQELLGVADILITDYSSCFFDFLIMNKPIIHFLYDYEYYCNCNRGLYYDINDVKCGECVDSVPKLISQINHYFEEPNTDCKLRVDRKKTYMSYDNENSCIQIYKAIADKIAFMLK